MKYYLFIVLIAILVFSCTKGIENRDESYLSGNGAFIVNEGNFTWGNGSLSYYSYDSAKIYNNIFSDINQRPLGDVPNSMIIRDEKAYILINNSGKVEVVNKNTLLSEATITGLISPRSIAIVSGTKAYVTSMYSDSIAILNLTENKISGYINLRRTSESIILVGNKAFVSNWVGGNEVLVVNTTDNMVIDSVIVGTEPESMVVDKNNTLWVLCSGGWTRTNFAELDAINTSTYKLEKKLLFSTKLASPSSLQIDGKRETLYFLESGVRKLNIYSSSLPSSPFIPEEGHYYYKLGINPVNGDIFATDASDYLQKGLVMIFKNDGTLFASNSAGIIPGQICFKQN